MKRDEEFELLTTKQAADYCGLTPAGLRTHIYRIGDLKPMRFGHDLAFLRRDLDEFIKRRKPAHRPRQAAKPKPRQD